MSSTDIIVMVVGILGGTALILAIVFGAIFGVSFLGIKGLAGNQTEAAKQRYPDARLIANASFFGQESRGAGQMRGNGTLVITASELVFIMWITKKTFTIPLKSITGIESPTGFLGKTRFTPLLKVVYQTEGGKMDAMAWQIPDLEGAKVVLDATMRGGHTHRFS